MRVFLVVLITATSIAVNAQSLASANNVGETNWSPVVQKNARLLSELNPPGLRMRNTGRTLTIIGSLMFVGGIAMVASADDLYYETTYSSSGTYTEGDPQGAIGVVMIAAGAGMTIPGIIFWSKGSKRYKAHLAEKNASIKIKGTQLAFRYRF